MVPAPNANLFSSLMKKSSRHDKITGDFAELLVLYWLSKSGYECALVDHTGIDIIAADEKRNKRIGISVQGRSRLAGKETESVNLHDFNKTRRACKSFGCKPYSAIVVDAQDVIRCFMVPLSHLEQIATGKAGRQRYWLMSVNSLKKYESDSKIKRFELACNNLNWRILG
jgi:Holliday junction resolvase-like predicted endonuclease